MQERVNMAEIENISGKNPEKKWKDFREKLENSWNNNLDRAILLLYASVAVCAFLISLLGPGTDFEIWQRWGAAGAGSLFLAFIYFLTLAGDVEKAHR